jgi:hypothetical protein
LIEMESIDALIFKNVGITLKAREDNFDAS